ETQPATVRPETTKPSLMPENPQPVTSNNPSSNSQNKNQRGVSSDANDSKKEVVIGGPGLPGPVFEARAATNISANSATLNAEIVGLVNSNDEGQLAFAYFEYGTSPTNLSLQS